MKSPGVATASRLDLVQRLSDVMHASRTIRSEVALTICESNEMRLASRHLRMESLRTTEVSVAGRRKLRARKAEQRRWMAHAVAQLLSSKGYSVFVAEAPQDTASVQ
jgi:hypothetical protein